MKLEEQVKQMAHIARRVGREEGKMEGLSEGESKAIHKIASKMKAAGMEPAEIAEITGISPAEIEDL